MIFSEKSYVSIIAFYLKRRFRRPHKANHDALLARRTRPLKKTFQVGRQCIVCRFSAREEWLNLPNCSHRHRGGFGKTWRACFIQSFWEKQWHDETSWRPNDTSHLFESRQYKSPVGEKSFLAPVPIVLLASCGFVRVTWKVLTFRERNFLFSNRSSDPLCLITNVRICEDFRTIFTSTHCLRRGFYNIIGGHITWNFTLYKLVKTQLKPVDSV